MKLHATAIALALASVMTLGGCANAGTTKLAVCDGRHRRPVNIHGSVLGDVPSAVSATAQPARPGASSAQNSAPAKPAKISAAGPASLWFPSC